ncbi:fatty acid-binding protein 1-like isoform X1 [Liolophura sinensis]|uniref:fatty acid-binding protein 1-like isoform X1 n=1 Tax=Liolophura sinensis TaxID=3198878 RepID=UPI0031582BED
MDKFVGKWEQTATENMENYLKATDVSETGVMKTMELLGSGLHETIEVSGNDVTITESGNTSTNQQVKKGTLGKEVDFTYRSGQTCKLSFTLEGGDLVETTKGTHATRVVRQVEGSTMTHVLTAGGVTATRTFKKA